MKSNKCSILINSCDSYMDVWEPFFRCFNENWPNCPFDIYLNTESFEYCPDYIRVTALNETKKNCQWGERLRNCLQRIDSEFIILLFDDFCLEKTVNQEGIMNCLNRMELDSSIDVFYLINIFPELFTNDGQDFVEVPLGKDYRLNSAPGIWRKSSLMNYTGKPDSPWGWEYFGTYRTESSPHSHFYTLNGVMDYYPYNYTIGGAIHRGKWVKSVIEPIKNKYNLSIDLSKRGFANEYEEKISKWWLIKFYLLGIRMVGPKALRSLHLKQLPARKIKKIINRIHKNRSVN